MGLEQCGAHPGSDANAEGFAFSPRRHAARAAPHQGTPARDAKLGRLLGQPEHPIAIGDGHQKIYGVGARRVHHVDDAHLGVSLRKSCESPGRLVAHTVGEIHAASNVEPPHAHVVRRLFTEAHRFAGSEARSVGEKPSYRREIVALHQLSSASSSRIDQPSRSSWLMSDARSSLRIPLRMARPSGASAAAIVGSRSTCTLDWMFASTTSTGASSGSKTVASPSITCTRSDTWFRSTFSRALPMASGSSSTALTVRAPSFAAAIDSTALPAPISATRLSRIGMRCINRVTPRVVAWSPVPNAIAGSMTMVEAGSRPSA